MRLDGHITSATIVDNAFNDLLGRFPDDNLFPAPQAERGIVRRLNRLDLISIDDNRVSVEARQGNHSSIV